MQTRTKRVLYALLILCIALFISWTAARNFGSAFELHNFFNRKTSSNKLVLFQTSLWFSVIRLHITVACIALLSGSVNVARYFFFRQNQKFHRINGYVYLVAVVLTDFSSGYLAPYAIGGTLTAVGFNLTNFLWLVITVTALVKIRKRQVQAHKRWMLRSYVICFLNAFIHLYLLVLTSGFGAPYTVAYSVSVYASLVTCLGVGEVFTRRIRG